MPYITDIYAREILDSRGNPTIEVSVTTESGAFGKACVPSGASTGKHEALELRDNDQKRYLGLGVLKACENVNNVIAPNLIGYDVREQLTIDKLMLKLDGTKTKEKLGANAMLGISLACSVCAASYNKQQLYEYLGGFNAHVLPTPMMNILNGGAHANFSIDFQEIMIMPFGFNNFKEALRCGSEIFHTLKNILIKNNYPIGLGDEGGFSPKLESNDLAIELITQAIKEAGYKPGENVGICLDVAASEFYNPYTKQYSLKTIDKLIKNDDLVNYLEELVNKYPIISIEDGMAEDDFDGWTKLTKRLGNKIQLVGDDLFTTNPERLEYGIKHHLANAILIKPNQIGTLSETFKTIELAKRNGYNVIISHRSGETEDTFIADLAVATNVGQIKCGSISRSERVAKYNQLLKIEDTLKDVAFYNGKSGLKTRK